MMATRTNLASIAKRTHLLQRTISPRVVASTLSPSTAAIDTTTSSKRWYRGESGEMQSRTKVHGTDDATGRREAELLAVAQPRYEEIHAKHVRLPKLDDIPSASLAGMDSAERMVGDYDDEGKVKEKMELDVRKKRLVYRSKQRGWLEVDLLLGTWANENVPSLSMDELDQFESFVNLETIDIYNVITLRTDVPEEMKRTGGAGVVERIQEWARQSPLGKAQPEEYERVKKNNNLI